MTKNKCFFLLLSIVGLPLASSAQQNSQSDYRVIHEIDTVWHFAYEGLEVARRSGLGSPNNMYLALRREYDMSASERRAFLQKEGDAGRFRL